mmetsp:Transcript_24298/g.45985  ORF Transcript_24298/g.45985 Transcript_24298/m.45985 type:complete len:210 (-) Transcript_24298:17-646(-)
MFPPAALAAMLWPFSRRQRGHGADLEEGQDGQHQSTAQVLGAKLLLLLAATFLLVSPALKSDWAMYVLPYAAFQLLLLTVLLLRGVCNSPGRSQGEVYRAVFRVWATIPTKEVSQTPDFAVHEISGCCGKEARVRRLGPAGARLGAHPRLAACSICMEEDGPSMALLPCGHTFCEPCIARWSVSGSHYSGKCPVCRSDFASDINEDTCR